MTYGQIAALCGHPRAARTVGQIARFGPAELPWHRVVGKDGKLAGEFPGGRTHQANMLLSEGILVNESYLLNIGELLWFPQHNN